MTTWLYRSLRAGLAHERRLLLLSASAPRSSFHYLCRPLSTSGSGSVFDVIPAGTTLSKQGDLEHYGVPNLRETAEKLVASSEHLLTPEELASTKRKTKELVEGQAGKRLQQLLVQRAKDNENWLADWWLDHAYLSYRDSVMINSNPGITFPTQNFRQEFDHLDYAARLVAGFVDIKEVLDRERLPVEMMGKAPMDMEQYFSLLGTTRIPGRNRDSLSFNPNSKHIVVFHQNNMYKLPVYDASGRLPLSEDTLLGCLRYLVEDSNSRGAGPALGVLTTDDRDRWNEARELLVDGGNEESLRTVETAILTLSLDPPASTGSADGADVDSLNTIHAITGAGLGDCTANRWFDKAVQVYVTETGESGLTYEHAPAEAVVLMVMGNHVQHCANGGTKFQRESSTDVSGPPERIKFKNVDLVESHIGHAKERARKVISDLELRLLQFHHFGKEFIKARRFSPDSFMQMAMQLTFYRIHRPEAGVAYETGGLRAFRRGRTDVIRSCSPAALRFAEAMLDPAAREGEKHRALADALKSHSDYAKMVVQGRGIDRHLLGLGLIAKEHGEETPEILSDPAWKRSTRHRISSSQVSGDLMACAFAPLVHDGYGCCYNIKKHNVNVACTAHRSCSETSAVRFRDELERSMLEMHDCLLAGENLNSKL